MTDKEIEPVIEGSKEYDSATEWMEVHEDIIPEGYEYPEDITGEELTILIQNHMSKALAHMIQLVKDESEKVDEETPDHEIADIALSSTVENFLFSKIDDEGARDILIDLFNKSQIKEVEDLL